MTNTTRNVAVRPTVRFLTDDFARQIIDEAVSLLCNLGIQKRHKQILSMLADHKAKVNRDNFHINLTEDIIHEAIGAPPHSFDEAHEDRSPPARTGSPAADANDSVNANGNLFPVRAICERLMTSD